MEPRWALRASLLVTEVFLEISGQEGARHRYLEDSFLRALRCLRMLPGTQGALVCTGGAYFMALEEVCGQKTWGLCRVRWMLCFSGVSGPDPGECQLMLGRQGRPQCWGRVNLLVDVPLPDVPLPDRHIKGL